MSLLTQLRTKLVLGVHTGLDIEGVKKETARAWRVC
jgi:hypothetical protein